MITPLTMHDSVCDFLEKEVAARFNLKAVDRGGTESRKHPQVIRSGWILPKSIDEDSVEAEEFPFIMPRILKVENPHGTRESVVTLIILYGVYDPGTYDEDGVLINDGSGYRDLWNLIETTRQALWRQLTLDNKYRVVDNFFEAEPYTEQVYPYWEGFCKTKWHVVFPYNQNHNL